MKKINSSRFLKKKFEKVKKFFQYIENFFENKNKFTLLLIPIFILSFHTMKIYNATSWMEDDAFISFRYAENFAKGKGLVFNEGERIEGYTNFLWIVLMAFFFKMGVNIVPFSQIISFIFATLTLIVTFHIPRILNFKNPFISLITPIFLASNTTYTLWTLSGMETHMFCFLFTSSIALCLYRPRSIFLPLLIALTSMTRPEGLILFGLTFIYKIISEKKLDIKFLLLFFLLWLPYFFWRYSYYGWLMPNTYYAKVTANVEGARLILIKRGFKYTYEFLRDCWGSWSFFLPLLVLIKYRRIWMAYLWIIILVFTGYVIYVGGDPFPGARFYLHILPILFLLIQEGIRFINGARLKYITIPITIFLVFIFVKYSMKCSFSGGIANNYLNDELVKDGKIVGEYFRRIAEPNEVIAVNTAGSVPYYAGIRAIDMLGLTNEHIAHVKTVAKVTDRGWTGHDRYDGYYVLSKRPDYILFGPVCNPAAVFPGDQQMFASWELVESYEPIVVRDIITASGSPLIYYRKIKGDSKTKPEDYQGLLEYRHYIAIDNVLKLLYRRGIYFMEKGDFVKAEEEFKKALEIEQNWEDLRYNLAVTYQNMKMIDKSIAEYKYLLKLPILKKDLHIQASINLGNLYYHKGLFEEAKRTFNNTLILDPNNEYAKKMVY
ncbi:TPA: hypothetical protein DCX16_01445 [bacterium]|nr:hypothetical protein [bacterium]